MQRMTLNARLLLIFLILIIWSIPAPATQRQGIRIIENNPQSLVIEFSIKNFTTHAFQTDSLALTRFAFDEGLSAFAPGEPDLPAGLFLCGIPVAGSYSVSYRVIQSRQIENVLVSPVPKDQNRYILNSEIYRTGSSFPQKNLVWEEKWLRSQKILQLSLVPFSYNPLSKVITVWERVILEIRLNPRTVTSSYPDEGLFEKSLKALLLNYESAKALRQPLPPLANRMKKQKTNLWDSPALYKIKVRTMGIYRITTRILPALENKRIDQIKLYTGPSRPLSFTFQTARDTATVLNEIATSISNTGDSLYFDSTDVLLFFGEPPYGWDYDSTDLDRYRYTHNNFSTENIYWLSWGLTGNRLAMPLDTLTRSGATLQDKFRDYQHFEEDIVGPTFSSQDKSAAGYEWYWKMFPIANSSPGISISLPSIKIENGVPADSAKIRYAFHRGDYEGYNSYTPESTYINDKKVGSGNLFVNLVEGNNNIQFFGRSSETTGGSYLYKYLDWYEILYSRKTIASTDQTLYLFGNALNGKYEFTVTGFSSGNLFVFDISNRSFVKIKKTAQSATNITFQDSLQANQDRRYWITSEQAFLTPPSVELYSAGPTSSPFLLKDLRQVRGEAKADYLILSHSLFLNEALRLAQHRSEFAPDSVSFPKVVLIDDIYNEFSGGLADPAAIRNFFTYAWLTYSVKLKYFVLLGDGNADLRGIRSSQNLNFIPVPQHLAGVSGHSYTAPGKTADDFWYSHSSGTFIGPVGRLPVQTPEQARSVVDKIIAYDDYKSYGAWRNRLVLSADDQIQVGELDDIYHTNPLETYFRLYLLPRPYSVFKVYLLGYNRNSIGKKPEATGDLINLLNDGVFFWDYVGHGGNTQMADEALFDIGADLSKLNNLGKPFIYTSFSCDNGRFDDLLQPSAAELFVNYEKGGAIACISATRKSYAGPNMILMGEFFKNIFGTNEISIGQALFNTRAVNTNQGTFYMYNLLGDPAQKFQWDIQTINFDSVLLSQLDTLKAKQKSQFTGKLNLPVQEGQVQIEILNAPQPKEVITEDPKGSTATITSQYLLDPVPIFRGEVDITSGTFNQPFLVSLKVSYNQYGRAIAFAWGENFAARSEIESLFIGGFDTTTVITDSSGPEILFFHRDTLLNKDLPLVNGNKIILPTTLKITLRDSFGIDNFSDLPDQGILIEFPGILPKTRINTSFRYDAGTFTSGNAFYVMDTTLFHPGPQVVQVTAWNNFGFYSQKSVALEIGHIRSDSLLQFNTVFNYPNPFQDKTAFYFSATHDYQAITVKIFTPSGRLIRLLSCPSVGCEWNGKDQMGFPLANGWYFYKIIVQYQDKQAEHLEKLVIMR